MGKEQELFDAARSGNSSLIEKILNPKSKWVFPVHLPSQLTTSMRKGIHVNIQDTNGETPLHHASLNNHRNVVEQLLKLQASANIPDLKGCFPLHLAAWRGNADICKVLLTHGPSVAKVNAQNAEGDTALHTAAQYGHSAVVSLLLQNQADPLVRNRKSETALDLACQYGRLDTVQILLRSRVSLLPVASGSPWTAISGQLSLQDKSPLHLAARSGHRNVVQALLDAGFDINQKTDDGSALHEASLYGRVDVVRLLLDQGIDVNILDCAGKTALAIVSEQKTHKSQEIEALITEHTVPSSTPRSSVVSEATYDQLPLSRPGERSQHGSAGDPSSRDSVNCYENNTSSAIAPLRPSIPSVGSDEEIEESIYDRPPVHLRVVIPAIDSNTVSDNLPLRSPNTPKKPPRKNIPSQKPTMVKGSDLDKREPNVGSSSSTAGRDDDQNRITTTAAAAASNFGDNSNNCGLVDMNCLSNGDNNNDFFSSDLTDILRNVDFSMAGSDDLDSELSHVVNNNFAVGNGSNNVVSSTNISLNINEISQNVNPSSSNSGRMSCSITTTTECVASQRPPDLNLSAKRPATTCVGADGTLRPPLSPTHYNQPPTPEHPPPSPTTAMIGIQEKINPNDRRRSRDMETITESEYLDGVVAGHSSSGVNQPPMSDKAVAAGKSTVEDGKLTSESANSDSVLLASVGSEPNPFIGLSKGSKLPGGVRRHESDLKVKQIASRAPKPDPADKRNINKRISAPPGGLSTSSFRPSAATAAPLEPVTEAANKRATPSSPSKADKSKASRPSQSIVDETEEWAKIEDIISSIGGGLDADMLVKEFNDRMCNVSANKVDESVRSISDWLDEIGLLEHENTLIANGYDDMTFMGPDVLDENDLLEIGILSSENRQRILDSSATFSCVPCADQTTLKDWLDAVHLPEYLDAFAKNNFTEMDRVRKIWEVDLTVTIGVTRLGHRRRILASLKQPSSSAKVIPQTSGKEENWPTSSAADRERHRDFVEIDQLMNWNSPLLNQSDDDKDSSEKLSNKLLREQKSREHQRSEKSLANANGEMENANADQSDVGNQWFHQPELLIRGHCNYTAQYLGSTLVTLLEGTESTKSSIYRLKRSTQNIAKVPNIILSISYKGVKFVDPASKKVICEHDIGNIFCACQDADDLNVFAYITRDLISDKHYCHVFSVYSTALATEIILTLGEAFEVAYQIAVQEDGDNAESSSSPPLRRGGHNTRLQSYSTAI